MKEFEEKRVIAARRGGKKEDVDEKWVSGRLCLGEKMGGFWWRAGGRFGVTGLSLGLRR